MFYLGLEFGKIMGIREIFLFHCGFAAVVLRKKDINKNVSI